MVWTCVLVCVPLSASPYPCTSVCSLCACRVCTLVCSLCVPCVYCGMFPLPVYVPQCIASTCAYMPMCSLCVCYVCNPVHSVCTCCVYTSVHVFTLCILCVCLSAFCHLHVHVFVSVRWCVLVCILLHLL